MAAIASPTLMPLTSANVDPPYRRPSSRPFARPPVKRIYTVKASPLPAPNRILTPDSSDEEDLAPIKLSAEAQAILGEDNSQAGSPKENAAFHKTSYGIPSDAYGKGPMETLRQGSPSPGRSNGSPAPRVVRLPHPSTLRPTALTTTARDGSFMYKTIEKPEEQLQRLQTESKTPAARAKRVVRVHSLRNKARSPPLTYSDERHSDSHSNSSEYNKENIPVDGNEGLPDERSPYGDQVPVGPSTIIRPRHLDENHIHSTTRGVKQIKLSTMGTRPIRRGMIRRQSEDDDLQEDMLRQEKSPSPEIEIGRRAEPELVDEPEDLIPRSRSPQQHHLLSNRQSYSPPLPKSAISLAASRMGSRITEPPHRSPSPDMPSKLKHAPASQGSGPSSKSSSAKLKPVFQISSLPSLPSTHDQENEPPPTFKRSKPSVTMLGGAPEVDMDPQQNSNKQPSQHSPSPRREALAARSHNTPHRPAPAAPPKMSLVEAATSNGGSSRRSKAVNVTVNGRQYRRLDCIGRGGSSRVYRVMAENFKIFALKRVNLEDADMSAIAGFKGEIDLLRKLENVDRVIKLIDFEINDEKSSLSVLMDLGESDFNKMLNEQIKTENAKLDTSFTRYYWKEMLQCVQAIHEHGIVHSDLKPANFLLVRGQLKLIDFGIANSIQDNTVNVHRENQIGTPNYMSPESLFAQAPPPGSAPGTRVLKLGRPSDVWSLGCILYQMTYGQPPFAHITKQYERIMSIANPKVEIQFSSKGVGGAVVPFGLIKTLRKCLEREQKLRPTIEELLNDTDPFLNPVSISPDMLGRMISNVVGYCRKKEEALRTTGDLDGPSAIPTDEDMKAWPWAFYDKLRTAQADGTAW